MANQLICLDEKHISDVQLEMIEFWRRTCEDDYGYQPRCAREDEDEGDKEPSTQIVRGNLRCA
ncbi:hypothetical protein PVK06_002385 [Gossypium arboreum]|uniref:Uncharacterized protein n=1 Tax=Gossypium arboreum TaxID=29729 RepID=A0ABR0R3J1_GOSAR|nr:hypothetical protein PVK06_002385 [Gossypium arboreum]